MARFVSRAVTGLGLAAGGAIGASWLGDHRYAWLGGALGAVSGAFAPSVVDRSRGREEARNALVSVWEIPRYDGERRPTTLGPLGLLDPRREIVEFVGRGDELADLVAWCEDDTTSPVRLITGPGGVGKSRLTVKLCSNMTQVGWHCVRIGDGQEADAISKVRAVNAGRILLVVDYAETRVGLGALIRAVAGDNGAGLRVLLLARSAGEWWDRLGADDPGIRELLDAAAPKAPLKTVLGSDTSDESLVFQAIPCFAEVLGVAPPDRVTLTAGPGRARILDLHAAALVAVLSARNHHSPIPSVHIDLTTVLDDLLRHEERFWIGSARAVGLLDGPDGMTITTLRRIVAAGCLLGAVDRAETLELLRRVPGSPATVKVATWVRDLYPPESNGEWLGALQPDRLAEQHIIAQLDADAELAEACLNNLDDRQAKRALTILGRASVEHPPARRFLDKILPLLDQVVADLDAPLDTLVAIANAIPYPSVLLANADAVISRRILDKLPTDAPRNESATWLTTLGTRLAQIGRPADALPFTEEAVAIRRELAAADPDRYRPGLAQSLSRLGVRYSELGRPADALPSAEEAVAIRRELAAADPDRYRSSLALSLSNLGVWYSELGRPADALPFTEEAVAIRRELAAADSSRYRPGLARSLNQLGVRFSELGRPADALPFTEEAVAIHRELASIDPDRYRPLLARSLSNLGVRFAELERPTDALHAEGEAVAIRRELAEANPNRYRPDLAESLSRLGVRFSELRRPDDALLVTQEAVTIQRQLATANPDRYRPHLADSLTSRRNIFSELGREDEAEATRREIESLMD
jgi:tetratricopeptide (TPR) repeat protein